MNRVNTPSSHIQLTAGQQRTSSKQYTGEKGGRKSNRVKVNGPYFVGLKKPLAGSPKELDTQERSTCAPDKGTKMTLMRILSPATGEILITQYKINVATFTFQFKTLQTGKPLGYLEQILSKMYLDSGYIYRVSVQKFRMGLEREFSDQEHRLHFQRT